MRELEVKILNMDLEDLEIRIINIGGELIHYEDQVNTLIDSEDSYIEKELDSYLRIREKKSLLDNTSSISFTMKRNVEREGIRENIEKNIAISNKDEMLDILKLLGYGVKSVGYKRRKSYRYKNIRFDLDIWDEETYPYPYMEIELENEEDLDSIIDILNIPRENISTQSIMELKNDLNKK